MLRTLIFAGVALAAMPAQAAMVTFDFTNVVSNGAAAVNSVNVAGSLAEYSVTVNSGTSGTSNSGTRLYQAPMLQGLGVIAAEGDETQVDGNGSNDRLIFDFNRSVRLKEIVFRDVQNNDEVRVNVDFAGGSNDFTQVANNASPAAGVLLFNSLEIDRAVVIARDDNDDFYVRSITVSQVPLPAAGVLFGSVLGLAGLYRRRKPNAAGLL